MLPEVIKTKYIVANESGITQLQKLASSLLTERLTNKVDSKTLNQYIQKHYNTETIIKDLNDFSNQCLIVYSGETPAGFAFFSDKKKAPHFLERKKIKYLVHFEVSSMYANTPVMQVLLEKCINVSKTYDALWLTEPVDSDRLPYFLSYGFVKQKPVNHMNGLPVESLILIRNF